MGNSLSHRITDTIPAIFLHHHTLNKTPAPEAENFRGGVTRLLG